jgi:hypothetical protein
MKIRAVKTGSKAKAVQVIRYQDNERIIVKHIGSAHDEQELNELKKLARGWIKDYTGQQSLFPKEIPEWLLSIQYCSFIGVYYTFFYELINSIQGAIGFQELPELLRSLVTLRIFEPASNLRSLEMLEQYYGIKQQRKDYYKIAPQCLALKNKVERKVINFAEKQYSFNFDILFYDVTTLYFESFTEDVLRKNGFSKDNKSEQPQILVALMVTKEGFPIVFEVFSGNTFEGHTIFPWLRLLSAKTK